MSVSTVPPAATGWQRVLDALMAAPDRTLTNVQLGEVPGVQAFHQRLSDLGRHGYLLTPAVRVAPGRYAYTLVGVHGDEEMSGVRYADRLPHLHDEAVVVAIREATDAIHENAEAIAKRAGVPPILPATNGNDRAVRDAAACLAEALGHDDPGDILALAHAARDEIARLTAALEIMRTSPLANAVGRRHSTGRTTGPTLMRKALEHHEQPMHSAKIAEWVMTNGGADVYKGATPAATMAAQLATSNKTGGEFVKVSPGCYGLREWTDKQDEFGNALLELDPIRA